jgi:hypothetical protein
LEKAMRRRDFIKAAIGAVTGWPLATRAQQQPKMPVIGFLNAGSPAERMSLVAAFRQALGEAGYIEGQNVLIEYRWAENQYDRLPATGGRSGSSTRAGDRNARHHAGGARGQGGHYYHSNRL